MSKQIEEVEPQCKEEILQVAELQSDDFHLDRPLYFACKADRKSLCAPVKSGEGRVFECLLKNKEEPTMSEECRVQLQRRQKLAAENYKVSRGLGWFFSLKLTDFLTAATDELLCLKNAGTHFSMFFT